jgi:uncharacterized repeat protein (TIGR01451 family)
LEWSLGDIGPQEVRAITVNCRAIREGLMRYCFQATAEDLAPQEGCLDLTISTPRLVVQITGPETAQVGQEITYDIRVTNTGTTPLTGVNLTDRFDPGLRHAEGATGAIELPIGTLAAGETRSNLAISFIVVAAGRHCHTLEVVADGGHRASARKCVSGVQAAAPPAGVPAAPPERQTGTSQLEVRKTGTDRLQVGAQGRFTIEIRNTGTTAVTNVRIADRYDDSLKPKLATTGRAPGEGPQVVAWVLRAIQPGELVVREVVCEGVSADEEAIGEVTVSTESGIKETARTTTEVFDASRPNVDLNPPETPNGPATPVTGKLQVSILPLDRPTRVGKDNSRVLVTLTNDRRESVRNVRVTITLPEGMELQKVITRGVKYERRGSTLRFEPIPELRGLENMNFEIQFRPTRAGKLTFKATVESPATDENVSEQKDVEVNER